MADIFISYASEDRSRIEPLAKALEDQGWSVWWDPIIPTGQDFDDVIEGELSKARCVVVIWTKKSIKSKYVKGEAREGLNRGILVPIEIESGIKPPFDFRSTQTLSLTNWDGSDKSTGFQKLIADIESILGETPVEEQQRKEKEEPKRRDLRARGKTDKSKPDAKVTIESVSLEPRKTYKVLIFGAVAGILVLLMIGGWLYYKNQQGQKKEETRLSLNEFDGIVAKLERAVAKVDNQKEFEELYRHRDTLIHQTQVFEEKASKFGWGQTLAEIQYRLKQVKIQLENKEKELIAARKGKIFVAAVPDNATIKILNIDQNFRQGMELEPGKYHMQVSSDGYEQQDRWIEIEPGEEKRINFELTPQKNITNSIGMMFVLIPAGKFVMGSPPYETGRNDDEKQHEVIISKPFYLQATEVSQGHWKKVMGNNPSTLKDRGDDCPVESVSWDMVQEFISKLNQMESTNKYRLPTEAEWEYACRAETETAYSFKEVGKLGDYAWYFANSEDHTHPVGQKKPNDWGLFDMIGNVWEWCHDWYGGYPSNPVVDPKGPDEGRHRVLRGGSYQWGADSLRSADRFRLNPDSPSLIIGFRVARDF